MTKRICNGVALGLISLLFVAGCNSGGSKGSSSSSGGVGEGVKKASISLDGPLSSIPGLSSDVTRRRPAPATARKRPEQMPQSYMVQNDPYGGQRIVISGPPVECEEGSGADGSQARTTVPGQGVIERNQDTPARPGGGILGGSNQHSDDNEE